MTVAPDRSVADEVSSPSGFATAAHADPGQSMRSLTANRTGLRRRTLFPLVASVAILAGCSDGDNGGTSSGRTGDHPSDGTGSALGTDGVDTEDPKPFTDAQLSTEYPSDREVDYVPLLAGFETLRINFPDVLDENLEKTLRVNQGASDKESEAAVVDEYGDMSITMGNALGRKLGEIYQSAVKAGRLPKTTALIHKDGGRAQSESTNPSKEYFDYDRPYVAAPDEYVPRDKEGGDAYDSDSGSYPSGHTNQAYWQGTLLATLMPELAPQILARTAESGHYRIVMAMHYPLDVIGGRMMGQAAIAKRWDDNDFRPLLEEARAELHAVLEADCGAPLSDFIASDDSYLSTEKALSTYRERMTYGFSQISDGGIPMDVPRVAAALLIPSHPQLDESQRRQVLEQTAIDSGYPLDLSVDSTDSWQRIDLCAAMHATASIAKDGTVSIKND